MDSDTIKCGITESVLIRTRDVALVVTLPPIPGSNSKTLHMYELLKCLGYFANTHHAHGTEHFVNPKNAIEQGKPHTNQILVLRPLSVDNEA